MAKRRDAREYALLVLFQLDLNPADAEKTLEDFWAGRETDPKVKAFAGDLVLGVVRDLERIDKLIEKHATHWAVKRIGAVDRNVIRIALYEMLECGDIPPVVSINEAIEIAKKYGSEESGKFVNGVLDCAKNELPRSSREAAGSPAS